MPDDLVSPRKTDAVDANCGGCKDTEQTFLDEAMQPLAQWQKGVVALTQELSNFIRCRFNEAMGAWNGFADCRTPDQFRDYHQRFATTAVEQYGDEFAKLSKLMLELSNSNLVQEQPKPEAAA